MNGLFAKENRIAATLSDSGKTEHRMYSLAAAALFLLTAFLLWEFVYEFCNMIGSVVSGSPEQALVELLRVLPLVLLTVDCLCLSVHLQRARFAPSAKARVRQWARLGRSAVVLGILVVLAILCGEFTGGYETLIEGNPTPWFPLDVCLGGVLSIMFGHFTALRKEQIADRASELPFDSKESSGFRAGLGRVLRVLCYMAGLCGFAACVFSTYVMDWRHGYLFFNVVLVLNYFTAFAMVFLYRFGYQELKSELAPSAGRKLALGFLVINAALLVLYFVAVEIQNEAPNQNAFGILPIEFTASFQAFPFIYGINNIAAPLVALLKKK